MYAGSKDGKMRLVQGTVVDATTGETLAGVKITVDGSEQTVYSDQNGNFRILAPVNQNAKIHFNFVSYREFNVPATEVSSASNQIILEELK